MNPKKDNLQVIREPVSWHIQPGIDFGNPDYVSSEIILSPEEMTKIIMNRKKWNRYCQLQDQAFSLAVSKNSQYGDDSIGKFGLTGVVTTMRDNFSRIVNLVNKGDERGEKIQKELRDLINYALYGIICLEGKWYE